MNPKGGSGKATIAINLASYFASRQQSPVLMDFDPQGSSIRWVRKRQPPQPPIYGIAAFEKADGRTTRTFQLRIPEKSSHVIVDTPAAIESRDVAEAFLRSGYFDLVAHSNDARVLGPLFDTGRAQAALLVPPLYGTDLAAHRATTLQFVLDGSDSQTATTILGYARQVVASVTPVIRTTTRNAPVLAVPLVLYNPDLVSRNYMVPGVLALIIMITITLRTSTAAYYFKYYVQRPDLMAAFVPAYMMAAAAGASLTPVLTRFFGREAELARLQELLLGDPVRLATLTGPAGCGKTRLALTVAEQLLDAFQDGVWLIELAALSDAALMPRGVYFQAALRWPHTGGA